VGLGMEHDLLARLDERLFGEWASKELGNAVGDLVPRAAQPRVIGISRFRQGRGGRLPHRAAGPALGALVGLGHLLKLEQQSGVFIPAQEPEQQSVGQLERPARAWPLELQETAVLRNGAYVLDAL